MTIDKNIVRMKRWRLLSSILRKGHRYRFTDSEGFSLEGEFRYIYDADSEIDMSIANVVDPLHESELDGEEEIAWNIDDMVSIEPV